MDWRSLIGLVIAVGAIFAAQWADGGHLAALLQPAGLLVVIMRSDEIKAILFDLVKSALTFTNPNDAAPTN